jgi:hypothetical protein
MRIPWRIWSFDWKGEMTNLSIVRFREGQWSCIVVLIFVDLVVYVEKEWKFV